MQVCLTNAMCHVALFAKGEHGGLRRESCRFISSAQAVVEFHAWQMIVHDPKSILCHHFHIMKMK
jgi:hypothetical protein